MNYSDIHTFLTIASSSSLSKAAELLFVSQPALSHRLSALEEELGTELIKRHKGSRVLELTEAGQRFVPIAQKWEELWLETTKIKLGEPAALLRIGNVDSLNFYFMPQVISSFLTEHKECSLHLDTMRFTGSIGNSCCNIIFLFIHFISSLKKIKKTPSKARMYLLVL